MIMFQISATHSRRAASNFVSNKTLFPNNDLNKIASMTSAGLQFLFKAVYTISH